MIMTIIREFLPVALAIVTGCMAWKYCKTFFSLVFLQCVIAFGFLAVGFHVANLYYRPNGNNQWVFNIYMLLETACLAAAANYYLRSKRASILIASSFLIFLIIYVAEIKDTGIFKFLNYAAISEGILFVIIYLIVLYQCAMLTEYKIRTLPEFWFCLGIILYFGCFIPYLSLMHYMQGADPKLNRHLFNIVRIAGSIRYVLTAVGFLIIYKKGRPNQYAN